MMQIVLAITSGAVHDLIGGEAPTMEKVELNLKSWSVLFSHVAGFATINAWGSLQQTYFKGSPQSALLVVPIGFIGLQVLFAAMDSIRWKISHMDDGEEDEFEHKWDEETEEAENDVAGLSLSFLTVQALRFYISGILPNAEGIEPWEDSSPMAAGCFGFFALSIGVLSSEKFMKEPSERVERVIEILNNYFTFGMSWCFFYGVRWAISSTQFTSENALLLVVIALFLSVVSFMLIFILDKAEDNKLFGEDEVAAGAGEKMIQGLGILIGFSWEQSFDTAVGVVAAGLEGRCPPVLSKLIMSVMLILIVFPAWRRHILPTEQAMSEEITEEGAEKARLKQLAQQHMDFFLDKETGDDVLDRAHLEMKKHRRLIHQLEHPGRKIAHGLKHFQVTAKGITEVDEPEEHLTPRQEHGGHGGHGGEAHAGHGGHGEGKKEKKNSHQKGPLTV
eukprot:CAMPEP_0115162084 /NCGR_PEP_ID=MMETSP0227-20121206/71758_1 /TAXON_ID=89957 /ORGANISM="Polarella glacialis, Strain CCMP 1383" /LENGTH=447 /DNA_ID=CAMNT_0002574241 /DNA_START=28 /DNA_END=1369 /DNA_ORIENTATION=-